MFKKQIVKLHNIFLRCINKTNSLLLNQKGFGINEVLGIAAGVIIAAVIVIPGLKEFAKDILTNMEVWWSEEIHTLFD